MATTDRGAATDGPGPPLTARGERTRTTIVAAARALFERQGYLGTNVGDIAKEAKVAHGTFYTYFASKQAIFAEVAQSLRDDVAGVAASEPPLPKGAPLSQRIERANRGYLRGYERHARMMGVLEQVATIDPELAATRRAIRRFWVERNAAAIRRWQEAGWVHERIDASYAANALGSMIDRSAYIWLVLGEPYEIEEATIQLTRLYCNALGLPYHRDGVPPTPDGAEPR